MFFSNLFWGIQRYLSRSAWKPWWQFQSLGGPWVSWNGKRYAIMAFGEDMKTRIICTVWYDTVCLYDMYIFMYTYIYNSESLHSNPLFSIFLESRFCKRRSFFHSVWCLPGYSNLTQRCRNSELLHGSPSLRIHRSSCWPSFFSQVDSRAPSIAWTGDLKRFVNLDPEDASEGSDEAMIEKTPSGYELGI